MISFRRLSKEQLQSLQKLGFVHITGLEIVTTGDPDWQTIEAKPSELGKWNIRNMVVALVTHDGQIWIGCLREGTGGDLMYLMFKELQLSKGEVRVPCSGRDKNILTSHILSRIADPYVRL